MILRHLANAYVIAYAADAGLSVVDECFKAIGFEGLQGLRQIVALGVFFVSFLLLPALAFLPRLPSSVFLPLALSALWTSLGALPLGLFYSLDELMIPLVLLQAGIAVGSFLRIRALRGGAGWLLDDEALIVRPLSVGRISGYLAMTAMVGFTALVGLTVVSVVAAIGNVTGGFVRIDGRGISLADRTYRRGESEIRLIGMIHVGQGEAYASIFEDLPPESTLILAEGVSDREGLIVVAPSYEAAARAFGLEEQKWIVEYLDENEEAERSRPEIRRADLDMSDFSPSTVEVIGRMGEILSADDMISAFGVLVEELQQDPAALRALEEDILERRNAHLIAEIDASSDSYERVVVPWGALHLPAIEAAVLERGFEPSADFYRPMIAWSTVLAALSESRQ